MSALLSVTALPTMAFAEAAATEAVKEATKKSAKELTEITLNEVAHSIFYAPQYVAIEEGYFAESHGGSLFNGKADAIHCFQIFPLLKHFMLQRKLYFEILCFDANIAHTSFTFPFFASTDGWCSQQ